MDTEAIGAPSPLELDAATMRQLAAQVSELVVQHLASLRQQPAQHSLGRAAAERLLGGPPPDEGESMEAILGSFREKVVPHHAREPHPRFIGYVPSCPTFPGVLGDFLGAGFNFFSGVWAVSSATNQIELTVLDWFRTWLGMPEGTSGLLTSGGSSATLTAVVAAREQRDPALLPRLALYTSDQAHSSVARAAWIAGIARANVRAVPVDSAYRMDAHALAQAIEKDRAAGLVPFMVVASAGTTNTGAVDPLPALADFCAEEKLWLHVDAAYAGFAALTDEGRRALRGIDRADSVTLDPHKWLFVPFECGCLLVREPRVLEQAFSVHPDYLADVRPREREVNFADYGEQLTRGPKALKIWLSVRYFGVNAIARTIARGMAIAKYAEGRLRAAPGFEILSPAQFGVLCFRSTPQPGESPEACNARNEALNARVNGTGQFLLSSTVLRGSYALRICTHGHRTAAQDVDALVAELGR